MVVVVADDPGIYSSQNEQDTRMIGRASMIPVIEPSDSEEARVFTKRAYELSEEYDTPIILRTTTRIAHSQGIVNLEDRVEVDDKPYERNIAKNVIHLPIRNCARSAVTVTVIIRRSWWLRIQEILRHMKRQGNIMVCIMCFMVQSLRCLG